MSNSNHPPGDDGAIERGHFVRFKCFNENCYNYEGEWLADACVQLGQCFLDDDDEAYCYACGEKGSEV